ncbi:hypothetical protein [Kibdelosporangium aridum]|nr:hypothetical protein [Kibdelosporangium aridum]
MQLVKIPNNSNSRDAGAVRTNRCSFEVLRLDLLDRFAEGLA